MKSKTTFLTQRHSREGGNLGKARATVGGLKQYLCKLHPDWIPACAGMTEVGCE